MRTPHDLDDEVTKPRLPGPWRGRVLLAEDDRELSALLGHALEEDGWTVEHVHDGASLIDALGSRRRKHDVVVTDVRMRGPSGIDALAACDVTSPVLVMSAFMDDAVARAATELGAAAVLSKPFDLDLFVAMVDSLRGRARGA